MKLTEHFTVSEFACPCCAECKMDEKFLNRLEKFRIEWGKPLVINSGFRCQKHNRSVAGVPGSQHLKGNAADISVEAKDRYFFVALAFVHGFRGIGVGKNFVHVDSRIEAPSFWKY